MYLDKQLLGVDYVREVFDHIYKRDKEKIDTIIGMLVLTNRFESFKNIVEEDLYLEHFGLALWIRNNYTDENDNSSNQLVACIHDRINRDDFDIKKWKEENDDVLRNCQAYLN